MPTGRRSTQSRRIETSGGGDSEGMGISAAAKAVPRSKTCRSVAAGSGADGGAASPGAMDGGPQVEQHIDPCPQSCAGSSGATW